MRFTLPLTLAVAGVLAAAACGGGQPEVAPGPDPDSLAREQARRDSIAREQSRRDSLDRARRLEEERIRRAREDSLGRVRAETAEVRAMLDRMVHFDFDRSDIRPGEDTEVLEEKLAILMANPGLTIEITGHCDERGSDEYNLALGNRRAVSAMTFLTNRGVTANRISVRSRGEEQPLDPGHTEDAWAQNRRDEFRIVGGGNVLKKPSGM